MTKVWSSPDLLKPKKDWQSGPDKEAALQATPQATSTGGKTYVPTTTAPYKKWEPPTGYVPERLKGQAPDPLSSAPAKKWEPYGGYDPRNRGAPAAASPTVTESSATNQLTDTPNVNLLY